MTRAIPGLVALALTAVAVVRADPIDVPPLPRTGTSVLAIYALPRADEKGKDEKGEKAGDKDAPKDMFKEKPPDDAPEAHRPPPIRYPLVPYPPAAPVVVDPRSGAWEQVRPSACGVVVLPQYHPPVLPATPTLPTPAVVPAMPTVTTPSVLPTAATLPTTPVVSVPNAEPSESVQAAGRWRIIQPYAPRNRFSPIATPQPAAPVPADLGIQFSSPRLR
jgi:hypothetical protein